MVVSIGSEHPANDQELTLAAKEAIRRYMLRIAVPSATVLAIISAVMGFLLNEWARGEAYVKAYGEASKSILDTATAAGQSRGKVESLAADVEKTSNTAKDTLVSVQKTKLDIDQLVNKNYDLIAKVLIDKEQFRFSLAKVDNEALGTLEQRVATIFTTLSNITAIVENNTDYKFERSPWIVQHATVKCSPGGRLVSASCVGRNPTLQAAVGPTFEDDGTVNCDRFGPTPMEVQATVICLRVK
jgi:hypothetical protein